MRPTITLPRSLFPYARALKSSPQRRNVWRSSTGASHSRALAAREEGIMRGSCFAGGVIVVVGLAGIALRGAPAVPSWPQWAQNPQHTGFANVRAQDLNRILADIVYDPLVPKEQNLNDGDLLAHYQ